MDGYYDVVNGQVVWRYHRDAQPDILPSEIRTDRGIYSVVSHDQPRHNEEVRLPDLGHSKTAQSSIG